MTSTAGAARRSLAGLGRLHRFGRVDQPLAAVHRRARAFLLDVHEAVVLPYVRIGRNVRLSKVVIDSEVVIPDGLVVGEDPELDAKQFPPHG